MRSDLSTKRFTVAFLIVLVLLTPCFLDVTSSEPSVLRVVMAVLTS